ncbi:uncharacterized protein LOC128954344 [Oppia nitens]|uniref:uncharacterized protein LOC128954344 n=1 Tax=Oppia nitens TaxID=1686743 RepID=UPI0023DCB7E7|nr:uncharacterized protein LOC128954344 [Oppia nitens]
MAIFGQSKYGKPIVVNENLADISAARILFIVIIFFWALVVKFREWRQFWFVWSDTKLARLAIGPTVLLNTLIAIYTASTLVHTVHYLDNIARPVDYYEPSYLYRRYLLSTMEITFIINFPIIMLGYYGIQKLLNAILVGKQQQISRKSIILFVYTGLTVLPVLHYRIEPIKSFSLIVNINILVGLLLAILLTAVLSVILYMNHRYDYFGSLGSVDDTYSLLDISRHNFSDIIADDDDDDEIETYNINSVRMSSSSGTTRKRSRSRSPTRGLSSNI